MGGRKYLNNDIFYTVFKKHFCTECKTKLSCIKVSKIVNSNSPEAKNYDFTMGDSFMVGDVEFIWKEFYCPQCNKQFSISEIKHIERQKAYQ